jgi:predicted negative regulator of RcsB-dependent stress response
MSESVYFLTIGLIIGTILLAFGIRAYSAVQQAKVRSAGEATYRQIAEKALASASENTAALVSIQTSLADVRTRLTSIEKILKEVE